MSTNCFILSFSFRDTILKPSYLNVSFVATILLSALLLFVIQPLFAKVLLPNYGGGSAVWTACMVFFQSFLLIGYAYAYGLGRFLKLQTQLWTHLALVSFISLIILVQMTAQSPIISLANFPNSPFLDIFLRLFENIGLPFFLLSTTAPLLQNWFAQISRDNNAYALYGASNIGAFIALFSYPLVIESSFLLSVQTVFWQGAYLLFAALVSALCLRLMSVNSQIRNDQSESYLSKNTTSEATEHRGNVSVPAKPNWMMKTRWLGLSALGVVLLVSTTSSLTYNVPPIPFLWTLPLALYLLTYILTFSLPKSYHRIYWAVVFTICAFIGVLLFYIGSQFGLLSQIVMYLVVLFTGCMICHGELYQSRPDTTYLTSFYLYLAIGGVCGSLITAWGATYLFDQYIEFLVALGGILIFLVLVPKANYIFRAVVAIAAMGFLALCWFINGQFNQYNIYQDRNFYTAIAVKDIELEDGVVERRLIDGYTAHGNQRLDGSLVPQPRSYYRYETGIGQLLNSDWNNNAKNVALVGLGVGALAHYGKAEDRYHFFELNPQVVEVANNYFDFLSTSKAKITVQVGDARQSLSKYQELLEEQVAASSSIELTPGLNRSTDKFDLMVIDAFSSDAIPVHLITQEALQLYSSLLADNGVLAFHISNSYLDLRPVLANLAAELKLNAQYVHTPDSSSNPYAVDWVFLSQAEIPKIIGAVDLKSQYERFDTSGERLIWSDEYSSLLPIIK